MRCSHTSIFIENVFILIPKHVDLAIFGNQADSMGPTCSIHYVLVLQLAHALQLGGLDLLLFAS